jgi:hypothetical protein
LALRLLAVMFVPEMVVSGPILTAERDLPAASSNGAELIGRCLEVDPADGQFGSGLLAPSRK